MDTRKSTNVCSEELSQWQEDGMTIEDKSYKCNVINYICEKTINKLKIK